MGKVTVTKCHIEGILIIDPEVFEDERGYFMETYNQRDLEEVGLSAVFVQDNQSKSGKGVLRGMHYQAEHPQGKLVRAVKGRIFDAAVDMRKGSRTYGQWFGTELSEENKRQIYVPEGFAHGFLVLSDEAEFCYKCTDFYYPDDQHGLVYNDPDVGIEWPVEDGMELRLLERDKNLKSFRQIKEGL